MGQRFTSLALSLLLAFSLTGCDMFGNPAASSPGTAYCWGNNENGQLGIGTNNDEVFPQQVQGGHTFTDIAAGGAVDTTNGGPGPARESVFQNATGHTCAVTESGDAYCWGANSGQGQLGIGTNNDELTPTKVVGEQSWNAVVAGGMHTCGVTEDGTAYCWGNNRPGQGQLGINSNHDELKPTKVKGDHNFVDLAAGRDHTCGIDFARDGDIGIPYCWGNNNPGRGQLGIGSIFDEITPTRVNTEESFESLVAGGNHTCGLTTTGTAYCWGNNYPGQGQLGTGTNNDEIEPTKVVGEHTFVDLAAGGMLVPDDDAPNSDSPGPVMVGHTCGVTEDGEVYCWGNNYPGQGQLGTGTNNDEITPTKVQTDLSFESVVAGGLHTCGVTEEGDAYCWGNNSPGQGQLGIGTVGTTDDDVLTPHEVKQVDRSFSGLSAGAHHTCGIVDPA